MLLEVVLALALFVGAATVITGGLNASVREVERLRFQEHANNLAATVLAEMQMGIVPVEPSGPNAFEPPFENWTWESLLAPVDDRTLSGATLQRVEIVVRHQSETVVRRLTHYLPTTAHASPDGTGGEAARESGGTDPNR